jgi:hypothetical protein
MNKLTLLSACTIFLLTACNKSDKSTAYNGFKVDGVVYNMDTVERDFSATGGALRIHSKDNGGALVYLRTGNNIWPSADGIYQYNIKAVRSDSTDAKVCFSPDGASEEYCAVSAANGSSLSTLTITISGGKWAISLPATTIMDNTAKTLEIQVQE